VVGCGGGGLGDGAEPIESQSSAVTPASAVWVAQGPAPIRNGQSVTQPTSNQNPVTGAVQAVAAHPSNANILYAATVNGGIWKTSNALAANPTWAALTDLQATLAMGAIALERGAPQNVIAGTGCFSSFADCGFNPPGSVLVSRNSGSTWSVISDPLFASGTVNGVVLRGSVMLVSYNDLARSTDGGQSWTRLSGFPANGLPFQGGDDLVEDNQNPNRLYFVQRFGGIYRSDNLGATWVNISQNDPALDDAIRNNAGAARVSTCNDGRAYVGVLSNLGEVIFVGYTRDGGSSWIDMDRPGVSGDPGNPAHFAIAGDRINSSFVYVTGIDNPMRGDAGIQATGQSPSPQWKPLGGSGTPHGTSPHVDSRRMAFDANQDLIEADDGGVFRRVRPRETTGDWFSLAGNMQSAEIHDIAYDANARVIMAGTQDNGTIYQLTPGRIPWTTFSGGDGGDVQVDATSTPGFSIRYSSFQFMGDFTRATFNASNVEVARAKPPLAVVGGGDPPNFNRSFVAPFELNRADPHRLVVAAFQAVYESFDQGDTVVSLGVGADAHAMAYGHPANPDVLYIGASTVFVRLTAGGPLTDTSFPGGFVQDVVIDPADFHRAYAAANFTVFVTPDAGTTWTNVSGNLASLNPGLLRSLEVVAGPSQRLLVLGADHGVFATPAATPGTWQRVGSNLPIAPVFDMQYNAASDLLVAGLLGRGAFTVTGLGQN
jgi:photosystem II stability/assembly factor-like uncharacterized protein